MLKDLQRLRKQPEDQMSELKARFKMMPAHAVIMIFARIWRKNFARQLLRSVQTRINI